MKDSNWDWDFDPSFPVHFFDFTVKGNRDHMHWHRYYEIGLCTKGTGRFFYHTKQYSVTPGDIFISNNYESHVAVSDSNSETQYIFMILLPNFVDSVISPRLSMLYTNAFMYNPINFTNCIPHTSQAAQIIADLIFRGLDVCTKQSAGYEMELDIIVRSILYQIWQYYRQSITDTRLKINPHIQSAQQYIINNYNRNLSIDEVAAHVNLNPSYFRHLFKDVLNVSFKEYITDLRLSHARKLLLDTNMNINRVIEEIGYTNISQFYRVFHQHYGMTPAEYRKTVSPSANVNRPPSRES